MAVCLLSMNAVQADEHCAITSDGDTNDFVNGSICDGDFEKYNYISIGLFNNPAWYLSEVCGTDGDGTDMAEMEIALTVSKRGDLRGTYSVEEETAYVYSYVYVDGDYINYDQETQSWLPDYEAVAGEIIITLSEDGEHYDLEYNLAFPGEPYYHGYVYGLCDSKMSENLQGIEHVQGDKVQGTKVLRDGQLQIDCNGKTYNAQGIQMPMAR